MNRRDFLKSLPLAPAIFLQRATDPDPDYQPIGYIDARLGSQYCRYKVLDKHTGEELQEKDRIVWADDRAGVYGRYKKGSPGIADTDIETVIRKIILVRY